MVLTWKQKHFTELTVHELYGLFRLRLEVFSIEQHCAYQDADGKDLDAWHLFAMDEKERVLACSRILKAGVAFKEASIGRVIISSEIRGNGTGKDLMLRSMKLLEEKMGKVNVRIGAQCYLKKFYNDLGFFEEGKQYLEDDIPHIEMVKQA